MQNQHQCGCDRGFVPVNGNWDFNMDRSCQTGCARRENRRGGCQTWERETIRERDEDCQCERCDDDRRVKCCAKNTVLRDMEDCERATAQRNTRNEREEHNECNRCRGDRDERNECNRCRRHGECGKCQVGMVNGKMQEIGETFESESALRAGTLFPELHMPLNGYYPPDRNCGTSEQAAAFAAWEMRLFLDTHPHDEQALCLFRKLCKEAAEENYATTFLTDDCCTRAWNWVKNPWPWEENCRCGNASGCGCRNT
ncbi:MAG: spore coat protein CotJB [Clostridiales bacterium]|nr:spore coat protein CotJB [Clostridiales bacterium]